MRAPAIRILSPQRRSLVRALGRDLPLKGAAAGLAVLLYVLVATLVPREAGGAFEHVPVQRPEVPAGFALRGTLGEVSVRVRGPEPAVARVGHDMLKATLDIAALDLAIGEPQEAPVRVTVTEPEVSVVEVSPATVAVRIEPIVTRGFTVQARFANEPPAGFRRGETTVAPADVQVSGPASLVGSVAAVYAAVRFGDIGVDLVQSAATVAVDASGANVDGLTVEPAAVQVRVPLLSTSTTRTLPVLHDVRGVPANGYWIAAISAQPSAVTVRGTPEAIASIELARTVPFDVSGIGTTRTFRVPLALPAGVEMLEPADMTITVTVQPLTGTRPFPLVAVVVAGLGDGLAAEVEPRTADVILSGPVPALAALAAGQVTATVDASGKGPGTYTLDVQVRIPAGVTAQSLQPQRVAVTIRTRQ